MPRRDSDRCSKPAGEHGAHLHIDMESLDALETTSTRARVPRRSEFGRTLRRARRAGVPTRFPAINSKDPRLGGRGPAQPTSRRGLVKGAYWDHELAEAPPARMEPHRCSTPRPSATADFEPLTAGCSRHGPLVRVAIASHNLRSIAHAIAYNRLTGGRATTSNSRCSAASATSSRTRSRPRHAGAVYARSGTWSPAWPTSSGACSRTPATTPSFTPRSRVSHSRTPCAPGDVR